MARAAIGLSAAIATLLQWSGPAAILWRVWAVVVDSVNGVCRGWLRSHIGQERLEAVLPSLADSDTATAPILVSLVRQPETTRLQVAPCVIFGRSAVVTAAMAVLDVQFALVVAVIATATLRSSVPQVGTLDGRSITTIAHALPVGTSALDIGVSGENSQAPETTTHHLNQRRHIGEA